MPRQIQGSQWNFAAGEVDTSFKRCDDHPARKSGLRQCSNFRILISGSVQNRSGRRALFPEIGRTDKIHFLGQLFYVSFGNGTLKIRNSAGAVIASNTGYSWTTATAKNIVWCLCPRGANSVDIVMTFAGQIPKIARLTVSSWSFLDFAFGTNGSALQEPFFRINIPGATLVASATTGAITLTASQAYFTAGMVGSRILYLGSQVIITGFTSSTLVNATVQQTLPGSDTLTITLSAGSFAPGDIIINQAGVKAETVSWAPPNITVNYLSAGTRFAINDIISGPNGSFTVQNFGGVTPFATAIWAEEVMSALNGWPASCFFDQGRLGFCNFASVPRAIAWSYIGIPNNFFVGATPAAAMMELIGDLSQVLYVIPGQEGNEFVFTDSKIFYIPISVTNPLKPGSVAFNLLSDDGAAQVQPRATQEVIIYVNAGGASMKAIVASGAFQRPFNIVDLSENHSHLFDNVIAIAAPHADTTLEERYVYVLNTNGVMAVGKYNTEQGQIKGVVGWVPFSGAGALQWVTAHESDVIFTTAYTPNGIGAVTIVEVLDDTLYLDAVIPVNAVPTPFVTGGKGPLFAFASGSVVLMDQVTRYMGTYFIDANGFIIPQFNGGEDLTLASLVAGQQWTATLEPFAPDAQPGADVGQRMKPRQMSMFAAYVINSTGFLMAMLFSGKQNQITPALGTIMNQKRVPAYEPSENQALAPVLREWVETYSPTGSTFDPRVAIIKDTPGPLLIAEVAMADTV